MLERCHLDGTWSTIHCLVHAGDHDLGAAEMIERVEESHAGGATLLLLIHQPREDLTQDGIELRRQARSEVRRQRQQQRQRSLLNFVMRVRHPRGSHVNNLGSERQQSSRRGRHLGLRGQLEQRGLPQRPQAVAALVNQRNEIVLSEPPRRLARSRPLFVRARHEALSTAPPSRRPPFLH